MPQRRILVNVNRKKRHPVLPQPLASSATTTWEGFLLVSQSWSSFMGAIEGRKRRAPDIIPRRACGLSPAEEISWVQTGALISN